MTLPLSRRRFLKQSAAVGVAALGMASTITACSVNSSASTLTIMSMASEVLPQYIDEFQRLHPEYNVVFLQYDPVRLNAMLNAGQPPDWVRIANAAVLPHLAALGLTTNLEPFIENSKVLNASNILPVNDSFRWDGHVQGRGPLYAISHGFEPDNQLWYNKRLFDQAGVKYPSADIPMSYDELLELAKQLTVRKRGKVQIYGFDAVWGSWDQLHLLNMLAQEGLTFWNSDYTEADFTTPEVRKAIQWYIDWAQAHVGPSPLDPDPQWTGPLFLADRLAMCHEGFWFEGFLEQMDPHALEYAGFAPAPLWGSKRFDAALTGAGGWIPTESKNKEGGWKFMEYYIMSTPGHNRATSGWGLPAVNALQPLIPHRTTQERENLRIVHNELPFMGILHYSPYISDDAFEAAFQKYINPVMLGQAKLDDATGQLTNYVNQQVNIVRQQI
jgi:multiple sugar transport system substrate-binding protein